MSPAKESHAVGAKELQSAVRASRGLVYAVIFFSILVNVLTLAGPLYMIQVYDRVLGGRSEATLVALSVLVTGIFVVLGILDYVRSKLTSLIGARFQERLDRRVFAAAMRRSLGAPDDPAAVIAQRDLEAIRVFLSSPVFLALVDLPLTPIFGALIFIFHPVLGIISILGGGMLIIVTLFNQIHSRRPQREAVLASVKGERLSEQMKSDAATMNALGMLDSGFDRWQTARELSLGAGVALAGIVGAYNSITRTFRMFLQSAMLGAGAWVVIRGEMSAGSMMAASILMGKTLSPVEALVGQWSVAQRAFEGWTRLSELLTLMPAYTNHMKLPRPSGRLEVKTLAVAAPGSRLPLVRGVSFTLEPGTALGVIGHSGSGKSSLLRAVSGAWPIAGGRISLGGAALDQYHPNDLGRLVGYVPQRISLFEGTIAENIARLDPVADSNRVVEAARRADAHDMILSLPEGYDTWISGDAGRLSGGQLQRIALARALYGDPVLVVLDEPNSNLDQVGTNAVLRSISTLKAAGACVLIAAHRPACINQCDKLLVLEGGIVKAFGPLGEILPNYVAGKPMAAPAPVRDQVQ